MAKRKAAVNDIIYELDNDDSEISSDDEVKHPKIVRLEMDNNLNTTQSDSNTQSSCIEIEDINSSTEKLNEVLSPKMMRIGGKSPEFIIIDEASDTVSPRTPTKGIERRKKLSPDTIFNEDIIIDSPASNSDPGVVGCENRTPLVTVRFRDSKLAINYKKKIKAFMLNLLKHHKSSADSDNETDLELDIWPEDLTGDDIVPEPEEISDNLFFIDTDPCIDMPKNIPSYSQNAAMISNVPDEEPSPTPMFRRKGPTCFNCNGSHTMRECKLPRNNARIAENRKAMVKLGRYHVEDEQKYGHLVAGRVSGQLRHALGLKRHELPLHIYRMRQLGYPPGWLEEARISHSGITLFDSSGQATLDPEEEEGEVCEPGSKDKYDIKKILDFPGFNVPASSRYKEDAHKMGLPPISDQDSKMAMLQILAPNAMKAYKRKKLTFFPSAPGQALQEGTAEMDIDSGDEVVDFPSQPPLPDDVPPPPPPPPDSPPPPPPPAEPEKETPKTKEETLDLKENLEATTENKANKSTKGNDKTESDDDVEVIEVMKVGDIPVPFEDLITIDVDGDVSVLESGPVSPSLDDLEQKKRLLLDALDTDVTILDDTDVECLDNTNVIKETAENDVKDERTESDEKYLERIESEKKDSESIDNAKKDLGTKGNDERNDSDKKYVEDDENGKNTVGNNEDEEKDKENNDDNKVEESNDSKVGDVDITADAIMDANGGSKVATDIPNEMYVVGAKVEGNVEDKVVESINKPEVEQNSTNKTPKVDKKVNNTDSDLTKASISTMGLVKGTTYGTPIINTASPYLTLPRDDKFAKDICDVINFENLPNSTGKYKQISTLLKKVKSEVDRIQES